MMHQDCLYSFCIFKALHAVSSLEQLHVCFLQHCGLRHSHYYRIKSYNADGGFNILTEQEEVSGDTTIILRNLDPDTVYNVAVVPVYPDVEGIRQAEKGKTSE